MYQIFLVIHILVGFCLVALVLVQQGKGASMGAAFGSGASQTLFGSRGSGSFLMRVTLGFVVLFFTTSIALNYLATMSVKHARVLTPLEELANLNKTAPVVPASVPAPVNRAPVQTDKK